MEISSGDRIIVLVDMDCFYVQVEQNLCSEYQGKPCAVVQYKTWKGGGIIAVNYEARAKGVTRMLRGDEAQKLCPEIHLFRVPEVRGKADLTRYREAGAKVLDVLCEYSDCVERASIDEAYLDMTNIISAKMHTSSPVTVDQLPNTFVIGWESKDPEARKIELQKWLQTIFEEEHLYHDQMLAVAAVIVEEMRSAVYERTGYRCSAGIAHNKMLAKLSCGINKPNKQTILPQSCIQLFFNNIPIKKVRNLGGKFGDLIVKKFNTEKMGDLFHIPKSQFVSNFGEKNGHWLYNLARGIENEPVTSRQLPKSIGCGKNFPGKTSLSTKHEVIHWLKQLSTELAERLVKDQENNQRIARLLTISLRNHENSNYSMISRSCPIRVYNAEKLAHDALLAISKLNTSSSETLWKPSIWTLSISASKFEDKVDNSHCNIESYLVNKQINKMEKVETDVATPITTNSTKVESNINEVSITYKSNNRGKSRKNIACFFSQKPVSEIINTENTSMTKIENCKESAPEQNIVLQNCCNDIDASLDVKNINSNLEEKDIESFHDIEKINANPVSSNENSDHNVTEQILMNYNCDIQEVKNSVIESIKEMKTSVNNYSTNSNSLEQSTNPKQGFFSKKLAERSELMHNLNLNEKLNDLNYSVDKFEKTSETKQPSSNFYNYSAASTFVPNEISQSSENFASSSFEVVYSNLSTELTNVCDKCGKRIPIWEEEEHLDYHVAIDLSKELNPTISQTTVKNPGVRNNTVASSSKYNRKKRGNMTKSSTQSKKILVQSNTLDYFFKR